jgi:hypothetical protein
MTSHIHVPAHLAATGQDPADLLATNALLIDAYAELIARKGVCDAGHRGRVSYLGHLRALDDALTAEIAAPSPEGYLEGIVRRRAMREFQKSAKSVCRVSVHAGLAGGGALVTLFNRAGVGLACTTRHNGDSLRLGVVELLPARAFSLHPYWPLDTRALRAQARRYVNRALERVVAELRGVA